MNDTTPVEKLEQLEKQAAALQTARSAGLDVALAEEKFYGNISGLAAELGYDDFGILAAEMDEKLTALDGLLTSGLFDETTAEVQRESLLTSPEARVLTLAKQSGFVVINPELITIEEVDQPEINDAEAIQTSNDDEDGAGSEEAAETEVEEDEFVAAEPAHETLDEPKPVVLSVRHTENKGTTLKVGMGRGKTYRLTAPQTQSADYADHKVAFLKMLESSSGEWFKITDVIENLKDQGLLDDNNKLAVLGAIRQLIKQIQFKGHDLFLHNHKKGNASEYCVNPLYRIAEIKDTRSIATSETPSSPTAAEATTPQATPKAEMPYTFEASMVEKIQQGELPVFELVAAMQSLENRRELIEYLTGREWISRNYMDEISTILEIEGIKAPLEYHDPQKKEVLRNQFMNDLATIIADNETLEKLFDLVDNKAAESTAHAAIQALILEVGDISDEDWETVRSLVIPAVRRVRSFTQTFSGGDYLTPQFETTYYVKDGEEVTVYRFVTGKEAPEVLKPTPLHEQDGDMEEGISYSVGTTEPKSPVFITSVTKLGEQKSPVTPPMTSPDVISAEIVQPKVIASDATRETSTEHEKEQLPEWLESASQEAKKYLNLLIEKAKQLGYDHPEKFLADQNLTAQQIFRLVNTNVRSAIKTLHVAIESGVINLDGDFDGKETPIELTDLLMLSSIKGRKPAKGITSNNRKKELRAYIESEIITPFLQAHRK